MERAKKLLEIETLSENLMKKHKSSGLLRLKILFFASIYENLSVSMIIDKIGIQKSNFALMSAQLVKEGLIEIRHAEIDRRCRVLYLTDKGREELNHYLADIEKSLGPTSPEMDRAFNLMLEFLNKKI